MMSSVPQPVTKPSENSFRVRRAKGKLGLGRVAIALNLSLGLSAFGLSILGFTEGAIAQTNHKTVSLLGQTQVVPGAVIAPPAAPNPVPEPFSPSLAGITDLAAGANSIRSAGQLRPSNLEALASDDVDWIKSIILPLYISPGGEHWGWIYQGWLIPKGQPSLAIGQDAGFAMIKAYENLYTFPVLEAREDGWFRVQYTQGGSAWAHSSQLELGDIALSVEGWEERLQAQDSVYFLQTGEAQALRSQPETATNMLSLVPANSLIEPIAFEGDWMQVRVTRPASACRPLTGATVTEGWMRWRNETRESLVWYRPGGCS